MKFFRRKASGPEKPPNNGKFSVSGDRRFGAAMSDDDFDEKIFTFEFPPRTGPAGARAELLFWREDFNRPENIKGFLNYFTILVTDIEEGDKWDEDACHLACGCECDTPTAAVETWRAVWDAMVRGRREWPLPVMSRARLSSRAAAWEERFERGGGRPDAHAMKKSEMLAADVLEALEEDDGFFESLAAASEERTLYADDISALLKNFRPDGGGSSRKHKPKR